MYIHHHRGIIPPPIPWGGVGTRDTGPYIYISIASKLFSEFQIPVEIGLTEGIASPAAQSSQLQVPVGN